MKYSSSFVRKYMVLWDWIVCFFIVNLLIIQNHSFDSSKETNTINVVEAETLGDHQSILVGYYNLIQQIFSIFQYIYLFPCLFQLPTEMLGCFSLLNMDLLLQVISHFTPGNHFTSGVQKAYSHGCLSLLKVKYIVLVLPLVSVKVFSSRVVSSWVYFTSQISRDAFDYGKVLKYWLLQAYRIKL